MENIPTVIDPNELHACRLIHNAEECSEFIAAASGICNAHTLHRLQPDPLVLRYQLLPL